MVKDEEEENEEDEESYEDELEDIVEESSVPNFPSSINQPISPVLKRNEVIRQPLEIELGDVSSNEENVENPEYGLSDSYASPSYELDSDYKEAGEYPETIQPSRTGSQAGSSSSGFQHSGSSRYPGSSKSNSKDYQSNLEQETQRKRRERERRMF